MIWILGLCFGEFCALGWDFHYRGWENLIFIKILYEIGFFCWFALDVGPLWQKEHVLRVDFMMFVHCFTLLFIVCMLGVYARCLIKCLLGIFSLVWTPISTKLWGFSCFLIRNMFGSLVVYLTHLAPYVHFSCIGHALHIATSYTHICYPCHALVYTLFLHPNMSCLPYAL